ncbi:aquaporin, partial [Salmonella enterica]|uniref:aquaporin n=1 Tax=Salmonella enterica TaxID=28901 RepID=UPI00398C7095
MLWEVCIIWGIVRFIACYLPAGMSGGNLHPAGTIALWLFACFPVQIVLPYIIAQFAGAFGCALLAYFLYIILFTFFDTSLHMFLCSVFSLHLAIIFSTYPASSLHLWHASFLVVVISSFLFFLFFAF